MSLRTLPWAPGQVPLMLAPMQGVTNRAVRQVFIEWVRPDVVFTEFMRVRPAGSEGGKDRISPKDLSEARAHEQGVPLVVQLIGRDRGPLVEAALAAQGAGAVHLNLNMGCPYGRMNVGCGGGMLERPEALPEILGALREAIVGTFSVKVRAGYDDPEQIFSLLPVFEACGVDFLVLHARTVAQRYEGAADHGLTARVVQQTRLPVIANGDVGTADGGAAVLAQTSAAGLMLGRGALRDPLLFERLRRRAPAMPSRPAKALAYQRFLRELARRYEQLFCGDAQVLAQLRGTLAQMDTAEFPRAFKALRKARSVAEFLEAVARLAAE